MVPNLERLGSKTFNVLAHSQCYGHPMERRDDLHYLEGHSSGFPLATGDCQSEAPVLRYEDLDTTRASFLQQLESPPRS